MKWHRPGDVLRVEFPTADPTTGDAVNADSLPTATLSRNGAVDVAVTVTVANKTTGLYEATCTIPEAYDEGDSISLRVIATVDEVEGIDVPFQDRLVGYNFAATSPIYVTPVSSTVSIGEVTPWAEQIIVYKSGPFGPFTIAVSDAAGSPLVLTGKTLVFSAILQNNPLTRFRLTTTAGKLTIGSGAANCNVTVSDGATYTGMEGTYDCSIRDVGDDYRVIARGRVEIANSPLVMA